MRVWLRRLLGLAYVAWAIAAAIMFWISAVENERVEAQVALDRGSRLATASLGLALIALLASSIYTRQLAASAAWLAQLGVLISAFVVVEDHVHAARGLYVLAGFGEFMGVLAILLTAPRAHTGFDTARR